jgi:hypothetical protein
MLKVLERERRSGALPDEVALAIAIHVERVTLAHFSGRAVIEQEATGQATAALDELEPIASCEIAVSSAAHEFLVRSFEMQPRPDARTGSQRLLAPLGAPGGAQPAGFIGRRPEIGWSLWRFAISRADFRVAEQLAGQLLDLADQRDPVACVAVHVAAGGRQVLPRGVLQRRRAPPAGSRVLRPRAGHRPDPEIRAGHGCRRRGLSGLGGGCGR